jgi:hypothetical protein
MRDKDGGAAICSARRNEGSMVCAPLHLSFDTDNVQFAIDGSRRVDGAGGFC